MIITPSLLARLAEGRQTGDSWPYLEGTAADIRAHLQSTAAALRGGPLLDVELDFYMLDDDACRSAIVYCTKRKNPPGQIDGVAVFLSAMAPLAAFCPMTVHGNGARTLHLPEAGELPPGDWAAEEKWLLKRLEDSGFAVSSRAELAHVLPDSDATPKAFAGQTQFRAVFF